MNRPKPHTGMINRRKAYLPMRTRRSLSVKPAENVVLTDGFPCVVAFDAHDRFISKLTLNRGGMSVPIGNSRKFPGISLPHADDSPRQHYWEGGIYARHMSATPCSESNLAEYRGRQASAPSISPLSRRPHVRRRWGLRPPNR